SAETVADAITEQQQQPQPHRRPPPERGQLLPPPAQRDLRLQHRGVRRLVKAPHRHQEQQQQQRQQPDRQRPAKHLDTKQHRRTTENKAALVTTGLQAVAQSAQRRRQQPHRQAITGNIMGGKAEIEQEQAGQQQPDALDKQPVRRQQADQHQQQDGG